MDELIERLTTALGAEHVLTGAAVHERATSWIDPAPLSALAIARPRTTTEVATVLRLCHAARQPVVVQGGRTNLVRATHTTARDLVISLERMAAVVAVDVANQTMTVQAGAPLQHVQEAAAAHGLFFPLDLAARGSATVGGCVAMNAGGVRVLRYGMMRELVLGLEVVRADGAVLTMLNAMLKDNAGYDLKHLFIGSEGTLGVVTQAVLRLFPAPRTQATALLAMDNFAQVTALLPRLQRDLGGALVSFEVMWNSYYRLTTTAPAPSKPPLAQHYAFYVLVEALGGDKRLDQSRFADALEAAADKGLFDDAVIAYTAQQRADLWRIREDSEQIERQHHLTFGYDVSLPISAMDAYVEDVHAGVELHFGAAARCWVYGHLGDGNLHVNVWTPQLQLADADRIAAVVYAPLRLLGGSISAEHGIGLEKKAHLALCRTPAELEAMRLLKRSFDPHHILNPGKVFDVEDSLS
ncbi:MAG: FAD-binding oxidoreductase [Caldilineaceae bacterium]|jgi:FAD/FMN-containing dehydrogenase|nr:FAD-binding oxidoreductase [Caldilineaceae bacterium]